MKRSFLCIFLAVLMTSLASCASDNSSASSDTANISEDTVYAEKTETDTETEVETEAETLSDGLGELDFGGASFVMYTPDPDIMTWANPVLDVTEQTGDMLSDAIYNRNRTIEERFNVVISESYGRSDLGAPALRTLVSAGDESYSVVSMLDRFALVSLGEDLVTPYDEIEYIDLSKPYWGGELLSYASIGGRNYFGFGDFSLYSYDNISALLFNKIMLTDNGLDDVYTLVREKKWTLDKFEEYAQKVVRDADGNGTMDENDTWGFLSMPKQVLPTIWISSGELSVTKDENDIPVLNMNDESFVNVFTKTFEAIRDSGIWYENTIQSDTDMTLETMFINSQSLFLDSTFFKLQRLRDMDSDFGIIPYPMENEEQDAYYSRVSGALITTIPVTSSIKDMTGAILEAMACSSRNDIIPVYYEIALKSKYSRDTESSDMLDIIFGNRVYDLGDSLWCDQIRDNFVKEMFQSNDRDIASKLKARQKIITKTMDKNISALTD